LARTNYSWAFDAGEHPVVVAVAAAVRLPPLLLLPLLAVVDDGAVLGLGVAVAGDSVPPCGDGAASFGAGAGIPRNLVAELVVAPGDGLVVVGGSPVALVPVAGQSPGVLAAVVAVAIRPFVVVAPTVFVEPSPLECVVFAVLLD